GKHRGRDVDGYHPAHMRRGRQCERPGSRPEVDQGGRRADTVLPERGEVLRGVRVSLLAVESRDERRVEMLRPGMRNLVDHPGFAHVPILAPPAARSDAAAALS